MIKINVDSPIGSLSLIIAIVVERTITALQERQDACRASQIEASLISLPYSAPLADPQHSSSSTSFSSLASTPSTCNSI